MYCSRCGAQAPDNVNFCSSCGNQLHGQVAPPQPQPIDPALKLVLPIGVSGWAVAAGYMGLFSVLLLPGPLAILLGILALQDVEKRPTVSGKGRAIFGIVMGILGSAGLVALAFAMLRP